MACILLCWISFASIGFTALWASLGLEELDGGG